MLWGGRNTANKYHWHVLTVIQPHWVCPHSQCVCFPSLHFSGSRLLCWELSEAGPGLACTSQSKPLRFRYSGTPPSCRLGWACVLCPSQVGAAQVTQVFGEIGCCDLLPRTSLPISFLGVQPVHLLRRVSTIQNPNEVLVSDEACLQFG